MTGLITLYGCFGPDHADLSLTSMVRQWVDILDFATEGSDTIYPYDLSDDETKRIGKAASLDELCELFSRYPDSRSALRSDGTRYRELPVRVAVSGTDSDNPYNPAYVVELQADAFTELADELGTRTAMERLIDLAGTSHERLEPEFSYLIPAYQNELQPYFHPDWERFAEGDPDAFTRTENRLVPWGFTLTPSAVERYGREHLLATPAYEVRELADGSIMIIVSETPIDEDYEARSRVCDHLFSETGSD